MTLVRLQKYIADQGIASRRKAETLIADGLVRVNGKTVTEMGIKIDPEKDAVTVKKEGRGKQSPSPRKGSSKKTPPFVGKAGWGTTKKTPPLVEKVGRGFTKALPNNTQKLYIIINKPIDYISSTTDNQGASVLSLITADQYLYPQFRQEIRGKIDETRLYPVGRLDKDSEGLVLLTNDGELTNLLTHPRYEHEKEYELILKDPLSRKAKEVLQTGMRLDDGDVQGIRIVRERRKGKYTQVTVVLKEGKNRQIRKMFGRLGYDLLSLKRTRIGRIKLGTLPIGKWRFVKKEQIFTGTPPKKQP